MAKDKGNQLVEKVRYYEKILLFEIKDESDDYKLLDLGESLSKISHFLDSYEIDNEVDGFWIYDIYHLNGCTAILSQGPPTFPNVLSDKLKSYYQLHLISTNELTDTVNNIYNHVKFFNKFKEVEKPVM